MSILKLSPACKDYIWGGQTLITDFNKQYTGEKLAETWELSAHKEGLSIIENGEYKGKTLLEYINLKGKSVLGKNCEKFEEFPILIKFIDAKENLSIQVHPNNEYALKNEKQYGKTEVWYIVDCKDESFLYLGFNKEISKEEIKQRIENNTILEVLNKIKPKVGDVFFIEAGTIHSIGKDIIIAEVQQSSNVTYRVYDYARKDKYGNQRELHIDKALDVIITSPYKPCLYNNHIAKCEFFTVDKISFVDSSYTITVDTKSFVSILVLDGSGEISCNDEVLTYNKGDCFFISAQNLECVLVGLVGLVGSVEALVTTVS